MVKNITTKQKINKSLGVSEPTYQAVLYEQMHREFKKFCELTTKGLTFLSNLEIESIEFLHKLDNLELAKHKLRDENNIDASALVTPPNSLLSAQSLKMLICIRGGLVAYHYFEQTPFPKQVMRMIKDLFQCQKKEAIEFAKRLSLDQDNLSLLQKQHETTDSQFKFVSNVLVAIQHFEKDVERASLQNLPSNNLQLDTGLKNEYISLDPILNTQNSTKSDDLLRYHLHQVGLAQRKQYSGIANLYANFSPLELIPVIRNAYQLFLDESTEEALVYLLCFILRIHVERLDFLPLSDQGKGIWIELEEGFLCWNRAILIDQKNTPSIVRIPLPIELLNGVKKRFKPTHRNLGDIFKTPGIDLKRKTRIFSWRLSETTHRPFLSRLNLAYGRFILDVCKDENYAAAISADFTLGVTSNFNYMILKAEKINSICAEVYQRLGFSGKFNSPVIEDVGSIMGLNSARAIDLIREQMHEAIHAKSLIHNKSKLESLSVAHNKIISAVMITLVAFLGLRKSREYSLANHTIDLNNALALIKDKASSRYQTCRLIPIPKLVVSWLSFYKSWIQSLSYRLLTIDKMLAHKMGTLTTRNCDFGAIPFLFYLEDKKVKKIGSRHIKLLLKGSNLESNFGRHLIDCLIRNDAGSVLINAFSGRSNPGQEPFGQRSALSVQHTFSRLRSILDKNIQELNLPDPPDLAFRVNKYPLNKFESYIPSPWRELTPSAALRARLDERCPFHEQTLINRRFFELVINTWFSGSVSPNIGNLTLSLIICDGVIFAEELISAVQVLLTGKIYLAGQIYFIDVETHQVGIRRVQLSRITMKLLSLIDCKLDCNKSEIEASVRTELIHLIQEGSLRFATPSLSRFLHWAQDYFTTLLSGPVRDWMCGNQHSRTLFPQAFARHTLQMSEIPKQSQSFFQRRIKIPVTEVIIKILNHVNDDNTDVGSNEQRLKVLVERMAEVMHSFTNFRDRLLAQYIVYLSTQCEHIHAPSTVQTYFHIVKGLLDAAKDVYDNEDLYQVDWLSVYKEVSSQTNQNKLSAINYFFRMLGFPEFAKVGNDPVKSARKYLDAPNELEIQHALNAIKNENSSPWRSQAYDVLKLMNDVPLRREDIIQLRVKDVVIEGSNVAIVITHASAGTKKTINADRVLFLNHENSIALTRLQLIKSSIGEDKYGLFRSPDQHLPFGGTDELIDVVDQALKLTTGSNNISPHSLRAKVLSEQYLKALGPLQPEVAVLDQRNKLYELSVQAGHADPNVTIQNYIHCFDSLRRHWVDYLLIKTCQLSPKFLSSLLGITLAAATKKQQRNFEISNIRINDEQFSNRLENFSVLLCDTVNSFSNASPTISPNRSSIFKYIYFRQLTNNVEAACLYSGITADLLPDYEDGYFFIEKAGIQGIFFKDLRLLGENDFSLPDNLFSYIKPLSLLSYHNLLKMLEQLQEKSRSWLITNHDLEVLYEVLLEPLKKVNIRTVLNIPLSHKSSHSIWLYKHGFTEVSYESDTKFTSKNKIRLTFEYHRNSDGESYRSKSLQKTVGLVILTLLIEFSMAVK